MKSSRIRRAILGSIDSFNTAHPDDVIPGDLKQSLVKRIHGALKGQLRVAQGIVKSLSTDNLRSIIEFSERELARRVGQGLTTVAEENRKIDATARQLTEGMNKAYELLSKLPPIDVVGDQHVEETATRIQRRVVTRPIKKKEKND